MSRGSERRSSADDGFASGPPGVKGVLHVCGGEKTGRQNQDPCRHVSVFVNDGRNRYLEDNDIRGFLDGRFLWGWNQESQTYVRIGRYSSRIRPPELGEEELFRILHRWSDLDLPQGSVVHDVRLSLHALEPLRDATTIYLYAVRRDWNPGAGGVRADNVSVPDEGEVWWNDARYGQEGWGLPGAGFASNDHPDADTGSYPLARFHCEEGGRRIEAGGDRLIRYLTDCLENDLPPRFLIKLGDWQEDQPESLIEFCSAEYGDETDVEVRPRLRLEWSPPPGSDCRSEDVFLEYGREEISGRIPVGSRSWISFTPEEGYESAAISWRESGPEEGAAEGDWREVAGPVVSRTGQIDLRIVAARSPVLLGEPFTARLRETWVLTAPPEDQEVVWRFTSPSGRSHAVRGKYDGDYTWRVIFRPDELGRWTSRWEHELSGSIQRGDGGCFDVVAPGVEEVCRRLGELSRELREIESGEIRYDEGLERLLHLERAGMHGMTPQELASEAGTRLREAVDAAREALSGRSIPEESSMDSHPLRREAGGRRFRDPIPRHSAFRDQDSGSSRNGRGLMSRLRSLYRRITRTMEGVVKIRRESSHDAGSPGKTGEGES